MPTITLHLEAAEYNAVARYASALTMKPEAIAYAGLNRLMLEARSPGVQRDIVLTWDWHRQNLPMWSDSAASVHAYEGKSDDESTSSRYF
jgi:hypothetical protein